jgi:DNA-binding transcriptional MerR regulator
MTMDGYRVQELADAAGVTVVSIRAYQSKGLLPQPTHRGRVALYGAEHLARLRRIRNLQARGYSLKAIAETLTKEAPKPALHPVEEEETFTLSELARRCGVPPAMLRSLEGSGILRARRIGDERRYTSADVRAVRMILSLVGGGLPMEEFLRVSRIELEAAEQVAKEAVRLFMLYVRQPLLDAGLPARDEAERVVAGLRLMVHASTSLMTYNFHRMVLNAAQEEILEHGSKAERSALEREVKRHVELALPA